MLYKRIFYLGLALVMISAALIGCVPQASVVEEPEEIEEITEVVIGVYEPMTGAQAAGGPAEGRKGGGRRL